MSLTLTEQASLSRYEVEKRFACCVFLAPDETIHTTGWLDPSFLTNEVLKQYWGRVKAGENSLDVAIDLNLETDLMNWNIVVPSALHANAYAKRLLDLSYVQAIGEAMTYVAKHMADQNADAIQSVIEKMSKARDEAQVATNAKTAIQIGNEFEVALGQDEHAFAETVATGIAKLDAHIGGLWNETLTVVCSRPSMGKTALLWQWARNIAVRKTVLFISLEQSERQLWLRAACGELEMSIADYMARSLTNVQIDMLRDQSQRLRNLYHFNLWVVDDTKTTTRDVWRLVAQLKPDVVICDHMRLFKDRVKEAGREDLRMGAISQNLKDLSREFEIPVVCAAQLSRATASRHDKRPTLTDLRDSGRIEEDADFVMSLHREDYYNPPSNIGKTSDTELGIMKFRDGATAKVRLVFHKKKLWFYGDPSEFEPQPELPNYYKET